MPVKTRKTIEPVIEPIEEDEEFEPVEETIPPFEEEDTITFKRSHFYSALSVLTFFAGILVGYIIWGTGLLSGLGTNSNGAAPVEGPVVEAPVTPQQNYIRYDVPTQGFYSRGPPTQPSPSWNSATINARSAAGGTMKYQKTCLRPTRARSGWCFATCR